VSRRAREPLSVGVIGFGSFGRLHALTLDGIAEAELVAIVDSNRSRLAEAQGLLPEVARFPSLEQALVESEAEAWIVASATSSHVRIAEQLLEAGHFVLVEKPLAGSLDEAEGLRPFLAADSNKLMMGHIVLFNSEFRALAGEVRKRGPLSAITCVRHRPANTRVLYPGEDPFHLLMVHDLYSVLSLVERREPVAFSAQRRIGDDGVTELVLAQLAWDDGIIASFTASFLTPEGMETDGYDRMEVFGRGWASRIEPNPRPIAVWDDRRRSPLTLEISTDRDGVSGMLAEELRCFCRVARGELPVPVGASYEDAVTIEWWITKLFESIDMKPRDKEHG
jgi:predicted dehydrogenase